MTGARVNEVVITDKGPGIVWEEIDLASKTWTLPPERMKKGRMHRVPLSDEAIACLGTPDTHGCPDGTGLVFGDLDKRALGTASGGFLHTISRKLDLRDPNADGRFITLHGFRATFSEWAESQMIDFHGRQMRAYDSDAIDIATAHAFQPKLCLRSSVGLRSVFGLSGSTGFA